ncbi:MAG: porphobilinogen synthase [Verrucomicrobia bacterium]|nr:MAG: porphobilinogen synthase [Verrucomicrobiota bacterium]
MKGFPDVRMRRLRATESLRKLTAMAMPGPEKFVWPIFVVPGKKRREAISAMPGQYRLSVDMLLRELEPVAAQSVGSVLLFGVPDAAGKDARGSGAFAPNGVVQQAIRAIRRAFPNLLVMSDVCLCAYTNHGHCGVLNKQGAVDNDPTLKLLANVAVSHAAAGAQIVAPSAMMDGQVAAIRSALDAAKFSDVGLMSYSSKFASAMYGPFREAEQSSPQSGDRRGYQGDAADLRAALRESALDEAEGADILMVKPALFYLDVITRLRERTDLPIAAYNVSGEYSMLLATAERGWGDLRAMVRESMLALTRAGADIIITYWAHRYQELIAS